MHMNTKGLFKNYVYTEGGFTWVQSSAKQERGVRPASVCGNTIKSQLSLMTFTKIVIDKNIAKIFAYVQQF